jgi:hypothetical protein
MRLPIQLRCVEIANPPAPWCSRPVKESLRCSRNWVRQGAWCVLSKSAEQPFTEKVGMSSALAPTRAFRPHSTRRHLPGAWGGMRHVSATSHKRQYIHGVSP